MPPPHPTSWSSILLLSSHLLQGLPSGIFPSGFPTKTLNAPHLYSCNMSRNGQATAHNSTQLFITASTISQRIVGKRQLAYPLHVGSSRIALSCLWMTCNVRHGAKRRVTDDGTCRAQWRLQSPQLTFCWHDGMMDTTLFPSRTIYFNSRNLRYSERLHDLGKITYQ